MIKIDQDTLCDFCRDHYEESDGWMCEGCNCEEISEIYLDNYGISEDLPENKTFGKLMIDDYVYMIDATPDIPVIKTEKINSLSNMNNDPLTIHFQSESRKIEDIDTNKQGHLFLIKKDCERELEKICTHRIVELSKVIGSLK